MPATVASGIARQQPVSDGHLFLYLHVSLKVNSFLVIYQLGLSSTAQVRALKVTVYLQGCLARKRCSACSLSCRYLNPYTKLKLMELAIKLYQEF